MASQLAVALPVFNEELFRFFANSVASLVAVYYGLTFYLGLKGKLQTEREKSWILTAVSRCVLSVLRDCDVG